MGLKTIRQVAEWNPVAIRGATPAGIIRPAGAPVKPPTLFIWRDISTFHPDPPRKRPLRRVVRRHAEVVGRRDWSCTTKTRGPNGGNPRLPKEAFIPTETNHAGQIFFKLKGREDGLEGLGHADPGSLQRRTLAWAPLELRKTLIGLWCRRGPRPLGPPVLVEECH